MVTPTLDQVMNTIAGLRDSFENGLEELDRLEQSIRGEAAHPPADNEPLPPISLPGQVTARGPRTIVTAVISPDVLNEYGQDESLLVAFAIDGVEQDGYASLAAPSNVLDTSELVPGWHDLEAYFVDRDSGKRIELVPDTSSDGDGNGDDGTPVDTGSYEDGAYNNGTSIQSGSYGSGAEVAQVETDQITVETETLAEPVSPDAVLLTETTRVTETVTRGSGRRSRSRSVK
jgi:hypothetical protein